MNELRILLVEDSESDAALLIRLMDKAGFAVHSRRVQDGERMTQALARERWDAIICDYRMPGFDAPRALDVLKTSGLDLPFIVVSGTIGEDLAVAMMRSGAHDYLLKDNLARLVPAVEREVREARARAERRETARQLQESQERLELAVQATQLGTFDFYVETGKLVWSDVTRQQFGMAPDLPVSPETFWGVLSPAERSRVLRIGLGAIRGRNGGDVSFEFQANRRSDGERRWLSTWGRVIFDEAGKPVRVIGTTRDITERKRHEEELKYQLDLTQSITHQTSDAIFVTDQNDCVTFMNPEAERVFGFTSAELMGRVLHDMIHHNYPDGRPFPHSECQMGQVGRPGETARDYEDLLFRKDGTRVYASCSSVPLRLNGEKIGVVVTIRDITERKRAEQALRDSEARFSRLANAGIVGIVIADREHILEANDYFLSMLGHTRETFKAGKVKWREITPPEFQAVSDQAVAAAIKTGSAPPFEKEYFRKNGTRVPVLMGAVMINYQNRPCFFSFVLDRTAHQNLEEQVRQSQKLDTLGQLAGGIAHDFNNLLTIILGYSQMISGDLGSNHPLHDGMEQIIRAATRAAALTRQLLTFSRQDQKQARIIRLNDVVRDVEKMLRRLISENTSIVLSLRDEAGYMRADAGQIEQVIVNLALNAVDAMPEGGTVWVETAPLVADDFAALCLSVPPGTYVQLVVSDTGQGMTPEVQSRIFEPFFTTKGQGKGTGLGLSTVYGIVKQSGGVISVHSSPGLGTTFRILFPATGAAEPGEHPPAAEPIAPGTETILLVEDEEGVLKYVREILTRAGYVVLAFNNGRKAVDAAKGYQGRIDLLVSDFVLPDITGNEIARRVQEVRPGMPVLVMSGYTDRLGKRADESGAYLQKPFSAADLLSSVRTLINGSSVQA
jgi:two-component system cell cycle sensor histidine kinase/response regulator CckA